MRLVRVTHDYWIAADVIKSLYINEAFALVLQTIDGDLLEFPHDSKKAAETTAERIYDMANFASRTH